MRLLFASYFRKLSIRSKLLLGYVTAFVFFSLISLVLLYPVMQKAVEDNIESELHSTTNTILTMIKASADASIKNYLRAIAEKNRDIASDFYGRYQQGEMSEAAAKAAAVDVLLSQRIGDTGYLYCIDSKGVMVVHPVSQLLGADLSGYGFIQTQLQHKNGYVEYDWKNPADPQARPKALYMTYFPEWDWIISASSYRQEFSKLVNVDSFRSDIQSLRFGETGYSFIINSKGDVVVHPFLKGNFIDAKDYSGRSFIKEIIEKKDGVIFYSWQNPGENGYRDKFAYFNYIPELDWIVASSSYVDEFYHPLKQIQVLIAIAFTATLVFVVLLTFAYSSYIVGHLDRLIANFQLGRDGDYSARIGAPSGDEFGKLANYFNNFMVKLESYHASLQLEIHERKQAEAALEQAKDSLERKVAERTAELITAKEAAESANVAKSVFLANMSHELRTPMNAILGYSQLLQRSSGLQPEQHEFLKTINRSGEHLLGLINNVLEISKIEARHVDVDNSTFDLHAMLFDIVSMLKVKVVSKGISFDLNRHPDLPQYIVSDEGKLRQILVNLLGNAVKFTSEGGITVNASARQEGNDRVRVIIEVVDTGPGIAENEIERAFKYLEQTESGRRTKAGSGLGLHISREYARMLHGDITVVSTLGEGSSFCVEFLTHHGDADDIRQVYHQHRVIGLAGGGAPPRVLVVDDRQENRDVLVRLLRVVGFNVREAKDGREAVDVFTEWMPNAVFMDIRMPVMDGIEATKAIRKIETVQSVAIFAITASVMREEQGPIYESGCNGLIHKPFREHEIFGALKEHLCVQYIYEDTSVDSAAVGEGTLSAEQLQVAASDIANLPDDLIARMQRALLVADLETVLDCSSEVAVQNPALASAIDQMANNYQYEALQTLLNGPAQESDHA